MYIESAFVTFLLVPGVLSGSTNCPSKCKCDQTSIVCTEKLLMAIPDFRKINFNPETVNLQNNDIEVINAYDFSYKRLEKVQYLELNDNSIFSIDGSSLMYLLNLEYLDLSGNVLESVPSNLIERNSKIKELVLAKNVFGSNTPELVSKSLLILDISSSKISTFSDKHLRGLPNLKVLYLHLNNLQYVDYNIFVNRNLELVDLTFNVWKCHCDTVRLWDYLTKSNLTQIKKPIECVHPDKHREAVYGLNGPIPDNNLCNPVVSTSHQSMVINKVEQSEKLEKQEHVEETHRIDSYAEVNNFASVMQMEILIVIGILSVLLVLSVISLVVVVTRSKKPKQTRNYKELKRNILVSKPNNCVSV